jgi:hypothetical protein
MRVRIIFLALTLLTADAQAPWYGAWKLNPAKSTTNSESRYKRVLLRIDPLEDGMSVVYDMVGTRGGITHMEWIGKLDGKDYPVQGLDYVLTNAYTRLNDRSYRIVIKVDGALAATADVLISADGKTLTSTTTEKNARGENITSTSVYERTAD